ncbi:MAG TPA: methylenetetrahydrofolate reductase, partial [Niabella sp.]|nr:methylenetetrahydrofolate reductase [Niabella sp.]
DLQYLKKKVDGGADYIVTQMFFDNNKYYSFVEACRNMGIMVPIIPGLKPIAVKSQLTVLPKIFHIDLPTDLSKELQKCKTNEEVEVVGQEWMLMQAKDLKKSGVPVLHFYTLGNPLHVANVVKQL